MANNWKEAIVFRCMRVDLFRTLKKYSAHLPQPENEIELEYGANIAEQRLNGLYKSCIEPKSLDGLSGNELYLNKNYQDNFCTFLKSEYEKQDMLNKENINPIYDNEWAIRHSFDLMSDLPIKK